MSTEGQANSTQPALDVDGIAQAERLADLTFTPQERELMLADLEAQRKAYRQIRTVALPNAVPPTLTTGGSIPLPTAWAGSSHPDASATATFARPNNDDDMAFLSVAELGRLLRRRQVSSVELTTLYLERLRRLDPVLKCVVTYTEELAVEQAQAADADLAAGCDRGPLHGIPWGAKDLLAVAGYPTTWGAEPYRSQAFDYDATVVRRLQQAGAVLVAKLTLGELAWGDVWFGGTTRTPWNPEMGSSGSSAGSAAATAAGLVGFAIGSETWGSIVSPATRCGVTGLRPTFGRISRHGAMALSWTMDKLGPLCRTVEDCALVFAAIHGADDLDPNAAQYPFAWPVEIDLPGLRIGYLAGDFALEYSGAANDQEMLAVLRSLGANLIPIHLPDYPVEALSIILNVEAAAAFDDLTRSDRDDLMVRQTHDSWPNVLRAARLIPAVEYIQAQRVRTLVNRAMAGLMADFDLYVGPSLAGDNLLLTNLTGHPAVVVPNGFTAEGLPTTITFTGRLFDDSRLLAVARRYQEATTHHLRRPPATA